MKTTKATIWTLAARQTDRIIGIASIAILARVLTPADFGLVALANSVVAFFEVFTAFGFDWAVVRLKEPTRSHYDTAWTLRVLFAAMLFLAISLVAWPLSIYLADARMLPVLLTLGTISLLGSVDNIGIVDFRRNLQFEKEFQLQVSAKVASIGVSVVLALVMRSYWALVAGIAAARVVQVVLSYAIHPFRPRWSLERRTELMSFSAWLLLGNIAESLRGRLTDIWIGRAFATRSVGLFSMAREIASLATTEFAAPINRVMFSRYSQMTNDRVELAAAFTQVSGIIWSIGLPAAVGTACCAEKIVLLLLGEQWTDAVAILRILAVGGAFAILSANTVYILWAIDRGRFVCLMSLAKTVLFVLLAIPFATEYGVVGMAMADALSTLPVLLAVYGALRASVGVSMRELASRNWRVMAATAIMGYVVVRVQTRFIDGMQAPLALELFAAVIIGVVSYTAVLAAFWVFSGRRAGPEEYYVTILRKTTRWVTQRI